VTALADLLPRAFSTQAFRLAAASAAGFLIAAVMIVGLLFWQTNELLTGHVIAGLRAEADELARDARAGDIDALADTIRARSHPAGPGLYYLATTSNRKLAGNLEGLPPEIAGSPQGGVFTYGTDGASGAKGSLAVAIPVDAGPNAVLIVGRDIEEQRGFASRIKRTLLWGFGFLSVAAVLAGLAAGRAVLRRIETINATSRSIMAGDLSRRIPVTGTADELDDLATSLNSMLDRIEQLMNGLREVSDNIAHDLKTPLNRLRNRAEAALRDSRGPDAYKEGLESTIERADDLIKTFNALLLIARLEAGVVEESAERFDLGKLVRDVVDLYEPVAEQEGLDLTTTVVTDLTIVANRQLVGQAVANLADNAIKYAAKALARPDLKNIDVRLVAKNNMAEISVADHGPGIAPKDRERALRRFVRLEESRTKPGTGLGLSLVAAVARLHGGDVRLEDNEPGLRIVLALPLPAREQKTTEARSDDQGAGKSPS
jgi:signal transduction histidine kinase